MPGPTRLRVVRALVAVALGIASIGLPLPAAGQARPTAVRPALTARLDDATGEVVAALTNRSTAVLEAWRLTFVYSTRASASTSFSTTSDTFAALMVPIRRPGVGPLEPGESRELRFPIPSIRALKSSSVDGALFGDLSFDGDSGVRDDILRAREAQAAAISKWIPVLADAGVKEPEQARQTILRAITGATASEADDPTRGHVEQILGSPNPAAASRELLAAFERLRELALRHRR